MAAIGVVGAGYVGLTTAACMAHLGHDVVCGDSDAARVRALSDGEVPIYEHGMTELVQEGLAAGRLRFVDGAAAASRDREVVFLCVPTPQRDDGSADMRHVDAAVRDIADVLAYESIVVTKSTAPVGSTREVERLLGRADVRVVSNPEFLREGSAVDDFLHPERIVLGSDDRAAAMVVAALYAGITANVLVTDPASSETIKYASNAFLATKLSFVNAIAAICERVGADIDDVVVGMGYDRRIGTSFMRPGPGWGGSCLPKDTSALLHIAQASGYDFTVLESVIAANDQQIEFVADKVSTAAGGSLEGATIAVWGLTFKALTDDLRDSPALAVVARLLERGARVRADDPTVESAKPAIPQAVELCLDPYEAAAGAHVLLLLTEWDEFRWVEPAKVATAMATQSVVDGRNLLDRARWVRAGFEYRGIGRS